MGNKQLAMGILIGVLISAAFYALFLKSPAEQEVATHSGSQAPSESINTGAPAVLSANRPDSAAATSTSDQVPAVPNMVDQLFKEGRGDLALPTGSTFELSVNAIERNSGVEQIFATVDPNGQPGFGLITVKNQQVVGTFNTPEGVYEMFGTRDNVQIKRASEIDGPRRLGTDFMVRPGGTPLSLPREGKTIEIQIQ